MNIHSSNEYNFISNLLSQQKIDITSTDDNMHIFIREKAAPITPNGRD